MKNGRVGCQGAQKVCHNQAPHMYCQHHNCFSRGAERGCLLHEAVMPPPSVMSDIPVVLPNHPKAVGHSLPCMEWTWPAGLSNMPQGTLQDGQGTYPQPQAAPLQVLNGPYLSLQGAQTAGRLPREARVTLTCRMGTLLGGQGKDASANFAEPEGARAEALVVLGEAAREGLAQHEQALRLQAMTGEVRVTSAVTCS